MSAGPPIDAEPRSPIEFFPELPISARVVDIAKAIDANGETHDPNFTLTGVDSCRADRS